uniref:Uncharacterized protein n=1 Tax=viral metagenome TaxID=1070528 RepID=A0A6C0ATA7_9ZZZZ
MEVIDLGALNDLEPISLSFDEPKTSVGSSSFGGGIELLMNDKKRSNSSSNLNLGELDSLENEINKGLGQPTTSSSSSGDTKTLSGFASNLFNLGGFVSASDTKSAPNPNVNEATDSNIGHATRESAGNTRTWDGFSKMGEIPLSGGSSTKMSERERRQKKRMMIKKLEEWYEKGSIKHSSHFTMDSEYEEIEDEYETALEDKRKKDSIKLQGWWFMTFINSMEYANTVFNPFDLNLDGWGEQISEDLDSYEEIFSELHDKYKGGKLAPEISLLLRVGFSAAVLNFSNKALSSATPAFNDVIKQSPELMRMFTNATVNSMSQSSPGFNMANQFVQEQQNRPRGPPPPAPVETKNAGPMQRPGMVFTNEPQQSNRPDINAGRGTMFREQGVPVNGGFENVNVYQQPQTMPVPPMQQERSMRPPMQQEPPVQRPEMRGPANTDIDNILSGLKTRTVNIHEEPVQVNSMDNDSMISISSLKDLQNGNMPKSSRRRKNKSDKNTISLDI